MNAETTPPKRLTPLNLWILLAAAAGAHLVLVVILSPGLFFGDDHSPQVLLERARVMRDNGEYQQAMDIYGQVVRQKPPTPAIFEVAEKELQETRLEALNAERRASQEAARRQAEQEEIARADQPARRTEAGEPADDADPSPATPLPALPSIDDF